MKKISYFYVHQEIYQSTYFQLIFVLHKIIRNGPIFILVGSSISAKFLSKFFLSQGFLVFSEIDEFLDFYNRKEESICFISNLDENIKKYSGVFVSVVSIVPAEGVYDFEKRISFCNIDKDITYVEVIQKISYKLIQELRKMGYFVNSFYKYELFESNNTNFILDNFKKNIELLSAEDIKEDIQNSVNYLSEKEAKRLLVSIFSNGSSSINLLLEDLRQESFFKCRNLIKPQIELILTSLANVKITEEMIVSFMCMSKHIANNNIVSCFIVANRAKLVIEGVQARYVIQHIIENEFFNDYMSIESMLNKLVDGSSQRNLDKFGLKNNNNSKMQKNICYNNVNNEYRNNFRNNSEFSNYQKDKNQQSFDFRAGKYNQNEEGQENIFYREKNIDFYSEISSDEIYPNINEKK